MKKLWPSLRFSAPLIGIGLWACLAPPVEAPKTTVVQSTPIRVAQNAKNQVDVLFMVDNSNSMDAMQTELRNRFDQFLQVFFDLAAKGTYADLHIGVVTSDYGAGTTANGNCGSSPGGQKGILQPIGAAAPAGCAPPNGVPFIKYAFSPTGDTSNLAQSDQATLKQTFTCMASVGSGGCGFEHQLESVYAALNNKTENAGFLRDGALLAVVFVTNEDDGSAPPMSTFYSFNANTQMAGEYTTYRQTHFGVACGSPPMLTPESASMLSGCQDAPTTGPLDLNVEYPVSRYTALFNDGSMLNKQGGDMILFGIEAATDHVETILVDPTSGLGKPPSPTYQPCPSIGLCTPSVRLQHSCQNVAIPGFFGDPAVRLEKVIASKGQLGQIFSICGGGPITPGQAAQEDLTQPPDFSKALSTLANLIFSNLGSGCIPAKLTSLSDPDCAVQDVTQTSHGPVATPIQRCDKANGTFPCWKLEMKTACVPPASPEGVGVTIDRNNVPVPASTTASIECATIAAAQ